MKAETTAPPAPASITAHQEPQEPLEPPALLPAPEGPSQAGGSITNELLGAKSRMSGTCPTLQHIHRPSLGISTHLGIMVRSGCGME